MEEVTFFVSFSHLRDGKTSFFRLPVKLEKKNEIDAFSDIVSIEQHLVKQGYLDPYIIFYQKLGVHLNEAK